MTTFASWKVEETRKSGVGCYDYTTVRFRWDAKLHKELGEPAFVAFVLKTEHDGSVHALVRPTNKVARQFGWSVKPVHVHGEDGFEISASLNHLTRDDAKHLEGQCDLVPAHAFSVNGMLVIELVAEVPKESVPSDPPEAHNAPVLPYDGKEVQAPPQSAGDGVERAAWAHTKGALKEFEHVQRFREQQAEMQAVKMRDDNEFKAQMLNLAQRETQALETIAAAVMGTAGVDSGFVVEIPERLYNSFENLAMVVHQAGGGSNG